MWPNSFWPPRCYRSSMPCCCGGQAQGDPGGPKFQQKKVVGIQWHHPETPNIHGNLNKTQKNPPFLGPLNFWPAFLKKGQQFLAVWMALQGNVPLDSYCCWKKSCDQQLRLVVYPIIYRVLYIPFDVSTVPSRGGNHRRRRRQAPVQKVGIDKAQEARQGIVLSCTFTSLSWREAVGSLGRPKKSRVVAAGPLDDPFWVWMTLWFGVWKGKNASENQHNHWKIPHFQ